MKILRNQGFTIIELVVVIIILGILAAFAVPRFAQLGEDARIAAINGLAGSLRSAAVLAHSLSQAKQLAPGASVTMAGQVVTMANSYPTGTAAGITAAIQDITNFAATYAGTVATYRANGATTPASCQVTYTEATAANFTPGVVVTTSGC